MLIFFLVPYTEGEAPSDAAQSCSPGTAVAAPAAVLMDGDLQPPAQALSARSTTVPAPPPTLVASAGPQSCSPQAELESLPSLPELQLRMVQLRAQAGRPENVTVSAVN